MIVLALLAVVAVALLIDLAIAWVFAHWLLDTVPYLSAFGTEDWFRVILAMALLGLFAAGSSRASS